MEAAFSLSPVGCEKNGSELMVGQKPTLTNEKQGVNIAHQKAPDAQ